MFVMLVVPHKTGCVLNQENNPPRGAGLFGSIFKFAKRALKKTDLGK